MTATQGRDPPYLVDDQRREGVTVDVVRHDEQRFAALRNLLEHGQQIGHRADLLFEQQDHRFLEHGLHLLGVGNEVWRQIATIDAHPFDHFHHRLGPLGFFDRCRPLRADFFERVGNGLSDTGFVVSGDRRDLDSLFVVRNGSRELFQVSHDCVERAIESALQVDRAGAGGNVLDSFGKYRRGQQRGRRRSVADHLARALGRLPNDLGAEVFLVVLQLELLGDRDPIVADKGTAPFLLDEHTLRLRTQRHAHGIGERQRAVQDLLAGADCTSRRL